jgi:hypothetical protein
MRVTEMPSSTRLLQLLDGAWVAQAIGVAAKLGLADLMQDGARSVDDLARLSVTHAPSLYRLLRALASSGIFAEREHGTFELTPLAETLCSNVPGSLRAICAMRTEPWFWGAWGELLHSVKTGQPGFDHRAGSDLFTFLERNPDALATFGEAMGSLSHAETAAILCAYEFSHARTIVDVGGGQGALLAAILQAHPQTRGVLFDRPETVARAPGLLKQAGIADRCDVVGGSFFERVPENGDLYILKSVIHDWDDDQSLAVLHNVRCAMSLDDRLLLIERVIPPGNTPSAGKWMDLNMLIAGSGRERTIAEYQSLLADAGFELTHVVPTTAEVSLIKGAPRITSV